MNTNIQGSQPPKGQSDLTTDAISSVDYPHRHKGYVTAFSELLDNLSTHNATILQGAEATGKTTLTCEVIQKQQEQGVQVITFTKAVNTPRQLYSLLAEALNVPKLKKDLVQALRQSKEKNEHCLVVLDGEAVNSSAAVSEALRKLCERTSKTAGAIKLLVVCTDYLVIHTQNTYETDFHDWIDQVVLLKKLTIADLEGLTRYLAELKHCPVPQYEVGTDLQLLDQSDGKIGRLITLINPLIDQGVIDHHATFLPEENLHPLDSPHAKFYFIGGACVLVLIMGLILRNLIYSPLDTHQETEKEMAEQPVFMEEISKNQVDVERGSITPPTLGTAPKAKEITQAIPNESATAKVTETPDKDTVKPAAQITQIRPATKPYPPGEESLMQVTRTVDDWISAWSTRDIRHFITFYSGTYSGDFTSRDLWLNHIQQSLRENSWIRLKREPLRNALQLNKEISVEFWLDTHLSSGYRDRTHKKLTLRDIDGIWKIIREENHVVLRRQ